MKRIYYIIFVLLLTLMSGNANAIDLVQGSSTTWAQQRISTSETVTISTDIYIAGPIIIPNGVTLTITRKPVATGIGGNLHIRPLSTYVKHANYPTCLFYVEQGGKLIITGQDIGTSYISLNGTSDGYAMVDAVNSSGISKVDSTDYKKSVTQIRQNLESGRYLDFVEGGMICAIGTVELQYVRLYGMYASSGRAGAIYRPKQNGKGYTYGPITISNSRITNNRTSYGAAIMVDRQVENANDLQKNSPTSCAITLQNVEIASNVTVSDLDAGAIRTNPGTVGNINLIDCKIYRNHSYGSGGAIYWNARAHQDTKLTFRRTNVERNRCNIHGAAMMLEGSVAFFKEGSDSRNFITKNVADSEENGEGDGGGIYIRTDGLESTISTHPITFEFNGNVVLTQNKAQNGAGVAAHLTETTNFSGGTVVNLNFSGLEASSNTAYNNGGGIYLLNNNTSLTTNFILSGSSNITANTAGVSGGGIYLEKGPQMANPSNNTIKFNSGSITSNTATSGSGGGIHLSGLNITSDGNAAGITVASNTSGINGGGISVDGTGGNVSMIISNGVIGGDNESKGNISDTGGGLYIDNATLTINGGVIKNNKSTSTLKGGGGVAAYNSTVTVSGGSVLNNDSGTANGGGLYLENCRSTFIGGTISGNKTVRGAGEDGLEINNTGFGGGVYIIEKDAGTSSFILKGDTEISGNSACSGAGVLLNGGDFDMTGGTIDSNRSEWHGGAICVIKADSFNLTSGTITNNSTTEKNGGAIYYNVPSGTININGANINNNSSANVGGAIYVQGGSLNITSGVISDNTSANNGGGINFNSSGGTLTVNGGVISNNSSSQSGGGVFFAVGTMFLRNGQIFENTAVTSGGALAMRGTKATVSGGKIYSNRANIGGGIHLYTDGTLLIENGEIYSNEATNQGAGMYIQKSGSVTINNGTIRNNTSIHSDDVSTSGNGGGIFLGDNAGNLTINGGSITQNNGYSGAGIYIKGGKCTINGGSISSNRAERNGAGIYLSGGSGLDMKNGVVEDNVAENMGGGIVVDSANPVTVNISGGKINTNSAPLGGGLVASQSGSVVNMTGGEICNNTARVGGGAYLSNNSTLNFGSGIIVNNKAIRMDDVTDATTGWYANDVAEKQFQGVGGGVCVANARLSFDLETTIGLYGNQADLLGDDIYSTGRGGSLSVTLPCVKDMNLTGYQAATTDLQWMEDYVNGDTGYANGTKVNTAQGYVPKRYRQALADKENVYAVDIPEGGKTFTGTYLALALGYDIMHLTLQRKGLMKGENAIYKISKWNETNQKWETYSQVLVSGPQEATTKELASELVASKTIAVYAGKWRAEEIGWDWSYTGTSAIERELSSATPKDARYFIFNATKDTDISASQHSESVVINDFGSRAVVSK